MTCRNELTGLGKALNVSSSLPGYCCGSGGAVCRGGSGGAASGSDIDFFLRLKNEEGFLTRTWGCSLGGAGACRLGGWSFFISDEMCCGLLPGRSAVSTDVVEPCTEFGSGAGV